MSAVDEYRHVAKQVVSKQGFYTIVSVADAAIAELEAELAELKARRCETCRNIVNCYTYDRAVRGMQSGNFACKRWGAK